MVYEKSFIGSVNIIKSGICLSGHGFFSCGHTIYADATAKAVEEILPLADSVTMALSQFEGKDVPPEFSKGIELIANQLKASFDKMGVTSFGAVGDEFDPNLHNAISKIEDENLGENTLAQVYQIGYKLNDKIIRHAMVVVANCD